MRISKDKLYPKLKGFFKKAYQYSEEAVQEDLRLIAEIDERRYITAIQYRYEYSVHEGKQRITLCRHFQTNHSVCGDFCDIWYCRDHFSIKLLDQLKFVEIEIAAVKGFDIIMDYYHNHFINEIQRKFDS